MAVKLFMGVMSTNRPGWLARTLTSLRHLDTSGFDVVRRLVIDDYPHGRDEKLLRGIVEGRGFDLMLHEKNYGLSTTWKDLWAHAIHSGADYIWHMEDDVVIQAPVRAADLADLVDLGASTAVLARQAWYAGEQEPRALPTDLIFRNRMRVCRNTGAFIFSPMASFYPVDRALFDYSWFFLRTHPDDTALWTDLPNEGIVGKAQWEGFGRTAWHVKQMSGSPYVQHIGEWTVGKKQIPGEPAYERFKHVDPLVRYDSKTGGKFDSL